MFFLSNRVPHALAAHQVHVQMVHFLPPMIAGVDNQAVAIFAYAFTFGKLSGNRKKPAYERLVFGEYLIERGDVFVRYDQDVYGSDRMYIEKSGDIFIFIHDGSWSLAVHDFAEDALSHISSLYGVVQFISMAERLHDKRSVPFFRPFASGNIASFIFLEVQSLFVPPLAPLRLSGEIALR